MPCSSCGIDKVFSRGLCGGCYHRLRRNGSVKRKYVINSGKCSAEGCDRPSFAKNFCQTHYNKAQHPLRAVWKLLRSRNPGQFPATWDGFERFLDDVGARPTPKHQLRRIDATKPYSKTNVNWLSPVSKIDNMSKDERSTYSREWTLQRRFNITGAQFEQMLSKQSGVCAICDRAETHIHKSGKPKSLSVDHCHSGGHVRGLLCVNCNRALGYLEDSIPRLKRAIAYLEKK